MNRPTAVALITGLVFGATIGTLLQQRLSYSDEDIRSLALAHEAESAGLCLNVLKAIDHRRPDLVARVVENRLASAIQHAERLTSSGASLPRTSINMADALRRGAEHVHGKGAGVPPAVPANAVRDQRGSDGRPSPR